MMRNNMIPPKIYITPISRPCKNLSSCAMLTLPIYHIPTYTTLTMVDMSAEYHKNLKIFIFLIPTDIRDGAERYGVILTMRK